MSAIVNRQSSQDNVASPSESPPHAQIASPRGRTSASAEHRIGDVAPTGVLPARVVFLTHYIPLYQVRVLQAIARRVQDFHVLLSTPIEPNRDFDVDWADLNVRVQKTITVRRSWRHRDRERGTQFVDPLYVHVPCDTASQLQQLKPDVVMSLELGARSLGAVRYCRKRPNVKSILCTYMSEHTEMSRGRFRESLRRYLLRNADAVTYNGPSCRRYLRRMGASEEKLFRLAYAADDRTIHRGELSRPSGLVEDDATERRLLCVGQLTQRKGVLPMVEQIAAYCHRNRRRRIRLRLAGSGPEAANLAGCPQPDNLRLELLGNLAPAALAKEMATCDALVVPTLADEWALVVNEALHAGLPVIGSVYAQATTTLIEDGRNGWRYDPCDKASLSRVLDRYFRSPGEELARMRQRARQSIRHCTPQWAASGAIDAIATLVSPSQRDPS